MILCYRSIMGEFGPGQAARSMWFEWEDRLRGRTLWALITLAAAWLCGPVKLWNEMQRGILLWCMNRAKWQFITWLLHNLFKTSLTEIKNKTLKSKFTCLKPICTWIMLLISQYSSFVAPGLPILLNTERAGMHQFWRQKNNCECLEKGRSWIRIF